MSGKSGADPDVLEAGSIRLVAVRKPASKLGSIPGGGAGNKTWVS